MSAWLDALLGKIKNSGVSLPLAGAHNFKSGLQAITNTITGDIDVSPKVSELAEPALAAALATLLRGVGLTISDGGKLQVRVRPRKSMRQDFFDTGNLTSGTIGNLNWNLNGVGTPAVTRLATQGMAARKLVLTTSATANDRSSLTWGSAENTSLLLPDDVHIMQLAHKFGTHTASKRVFFGLSANFTTEPSAAADCIGLMYDAGVSPNYLIISRAGSVGTPVNTGVPVVSDTHELTTVYVPTDGNQWQFFSGDTLLGSVDTSAVSTAGMNLGVRLETTAAVARVHHLAYFGFESKQLSGCLDDDDFLEV